MWWAFDLSCSGGGAALDVSLGCWFSRKRKHTQTRRYRHILFAFFNVASFFFFFFFFKLTFYLHSHCGLLTNERMNE